MNKKILILIILNAFIIISVMFSLKMSYAVNPYCATPPFITTSVTPNVLIILDNSNSMDEDFYGNAVGSYSPASKTVVAKVALRSMINKLKKKLRIGLMTYRLPNGIDAYHIHNSPYFVSYNPQSYCPSHSSVCLDNTSKTCNEDSDCNSGSCVDPCVKYCQTLDMNYGSVCESQCQNGNSDFNLNYFDEIINYYSVGSEQRNRYCRLVYPKTQRMVNPTDTNHYIYFKHAYPFYSYYNQGTEFGYSKNYNPQEGQPWDYYSFYNIKVGTGDGFTGYRSGAGGFQIYPTDSDIALGYKDFGKRIMWEHIGPTWFSNSSPGDGYLHVSIGNLAYDNGSETQTYDNLYNILDPKTNDEAGYMSCNRGNKNRCSYIVNAGLTPTAGTLQSAINYFEGSNTPIQYRCQKNFIVYVTDGLPSVDENGNEGSASALMPAVLNKLDDLRHISKTINGTSYTFDIKTYVLGVGLAKEAKKELDKMAVNGGTDVKGHAYYADNATELNNALNKIFSDIAKQTSAGSSVSVLARKVKMGSLLNQAVFYAEKDMGDNNTALRWTGQLFTYWFYNDRGVQNIREDTVNNHKLDVCSNGSPGGDEILVFDVDSQTGQLEIKKYKSNCNGTDNETDSTVNSLDELKDLWEAGEKLAGRDYDNRTIYTAIVNNNTDNNTDLISFDIADNASFMNYLGRDNYTDSSTPFPDNMSVGNIINYIRGLDYTGARNRSYSDSGTTKTWKLGDIIYSSPKVVDYNNYAMVYVGANDGMLHAFRLGYLSRSNLSRYQKAELTNSKNDSGYGKLGQEEWAFIPKDVLPYLRYLADPNYCHIYTVDLTPYMVYSITDNNTVKKILIGGMRMGGGVTGCSASNGCINPPSDTCPAAEYGSDNGSCVGRSSYFALDITNPTKPKFLWEFNRSGLGFSYSGPGIIKRKDSYGKTIYYVVFTSGPTNYKGVSKQDLHLYILKLKSDFTIDTVYNETGKVSNQNNAFGSRIMSNGIDRDGDGNTDLLFFGMTQLNGTAWQGNVFAIRPTDNDTNPDDWDYYKVFNHGTSAITSSIEYMKCFNHDYIYFGTGRWYFKTDDPGQNSNDIENLYGVCIDGCFDGNCNINQAKNTTESCDELDSNRSVWAYKIDLDPKSTGYFKERFISNPLVDPYDNLVFFATTEPSSDICSFGGRSRLWGLNCATGRNMFSSCPNGKYASNVLSNTVYMQLSRGNIVQANKESFYDNNGNPSSTTKWHQGITPETSPILPPPYTGVTGSILLWLEK